MKSGTKLTAICLAVAGLLLGASTQAGQLRGDVRRNVLQQARIVQGARSGALTRGEAARLEVGQLRVERRESLAAANGHVIGAEQAGIDRLQDRQNRRIFRLKHNARAG